MRLEQLLDEEDMEVDQRDPQTGATALHLACLHGQTAAVEALCDEGASINPQVALPPPSLRLCSRIWRGTGTGPMRTGSTICGQGGGQPC